ncbi:hypothetical protein [Mammaliicoccus sciuri]|uniref:hypothetical protein n=1 Tax=Mammaliicoccus sciuri TaxID=1296 RepID=UPI001E52D10A|nr:hypothetical protein [Mammaliicoccus sciuri]MCD8770767.1 hypothetical protein [Mammaliicoccus sciuri]
MELIKFMKKKVSENDHNMNVSKDELNKMYKLKDDGYLLEIRSEEFPDGTYDVMFVPTEKFKEL